ncbi:MAG TPA: YidC/Oxa1 family membrane protein insertase [Acidimicrobiia bacterium]|jgi:YidC/Oxa1 family membrane protein insertase
MGQLLTGLEKVLGTVLAFLYGLIPNYGVAIILLTILVNLLLFPLTLKQTRSTRAFQQIQPEIRRIQKEYKEEPETMQRELMRVQKEAGATPGGCLLPMLIQFPIWIALFRLLSDPICQSGTAGCEIKVPPESDLYTAIAAGQTTFLGMDLGTRVSEAVAQGVLVALPYLLMLVIMVATQYVQQWHATSGQPRATGPGQAGQMLTRIMPLFIGFISYNFPAGLVLYWMTGNLFRLGQQVLIFRIDGRPAPPPAPEPPPKKAEEPKPQQPPAGRRRKRRK